MNAIVLLSINEVELSIYRFLSSRVKNNKRQPRPVDLGSTGSLAVGAFNVWQVTVALTGPRPILDLSSTGKRRLLGEREGF